jgi:Lysylphosphatidylglycerol synthase TM region
MPEARGDKLISQAENGSDAPQSGAPSRAMLFVRKALPYLGTVAIFALIFWRIPIAKVGAALRQAPVLEFLGVFLPYSMFYWFIDSACLTWVIRRFNVKLRFRDILPIRASMYLLSMINTNLGQGGVAWYVHRKAATPFLEVLSSILFIAVLEIYQLVLFSTSGVIFYTPRTAAQFEMVRVLRITYVAAWLLLALIILFFIQVRRSSWLRGWLQAGKLGSITRTFVAARPLDYGIVLGIKAPAFAFSLLAQHFALQLYGIAIPLVKLVLFLPLVFLAAALPISVAHLGTSQAAWLLFFSSNAPAAKILAYSLAAHFAFMFCNGFIGLLFLPRASRELAVLGAERSSDASQPNPATVSD